MRKRHLLLMLAAAVVVALVVVFAVVSTRPALDLEVTASSTAAGTDPRSVLEESTDSGVWRSEGETLGAWLRMEWSQPRPVDRIRIRGAGAPESGFTSAVAAFGDGSFLHLSPDGEGEVDVSFPERTVGTVQVTFAGAAPGAESVAISLLRIDRTGSWDGAEPGAATTAEVSSSAPGYGAEGLTDGDLGESGEWRADPDDPAAWAELRWGDPRVISAVQIHGPTGSWLDPAYAAAAPLNGRLLFDDGSTVVVSGIAGDFAGPTTIAFAPRVAQRIRLELERTITQAEIGLREFAAFSEGETPPRWEPASSADYSLSPEAADCPSAPLAEERPVRLILLCPTPGAAVSGEATLVVRAAPRAHIDAAVIRSGDGADGGRLTIASSVSDDEGVATLTFSTGDLPHGPLGVEVMASTGDFSDGLGDPLHVHLFNEGGVEVEVDDSTASREGMTLQWEEEFDEPVSVSAFGADTVYAATRPAYWGVTSFGEAVFADPEWGEDTIATLGAEYLRIRVQPLGDREDPNGWGREHISGMLSSFAVGATGFAAQYGYFEARILGAAGPGTWPAFWMLNTESATRNTEAFAEVDAVELYGHDTSTTCHATHSWSDEGARDDGEVDCLQPETVTDWAMTWHTYGVQLRPGGADFYVDGVLVASHDDLSHTDEPFFFMLNLALGGGWPVDLVGTGGIADLYVDYVRVYT